MQASPSSSSAEKRGSESARSSYARSTLLALPAELQYQILSYLPIQDQLSVAKICFLWKDIVLNDKAIQQTRYSYSFSSVVCGHILTSAWIEDSSKPAFSFMVQNGVIKRFRYPYETHESSEGTQTILDKDMTGETPPKFDGDITDCIFLDEPLFTPFPTSAPAPFRFCEDSDQTPLLTKKRLQFTGTEEEAKVGSYAWYHLYYYETREDEVGTRTRTLLDPEMTIKESDNFVITASLNIFSTAGEWSGDLWDAKVNPRKGSSVREILEAVLMETEPIIRDLGIKTENLHETFCMGFQIANNVWSLAFGVIADDADTDYTLK
ncbi:hypothetical protein TWF106_009617 [Orbilia oligospora]|uniref:F-box domain-containing protein n=1 Tax=Orbilia oligospora TaxID=2813651 RepID=A0A6G1MII7_ORBOL|nr:hypothetical protein TWF679_009427 [Orbilia oligospora]KAF3213041.1 hypothetical protein TWF106_009617 [Orbilia oligospora]KAF3223220.1 hypothetical protein TWF191_006501 [Orbilia oligospora]KAF3259640.1 hypothetical protein TWF192_010497 [Orbilia oligospora]